MTKKPMFDFVIGNPPYQDGRKQIYANFFAASKDIADCLELIFPTGWQSPKTANGLSILNTESVKQDPQIVFIQNKTDVFHGVAGAKYTNIVLWKNGYDNGLGGKQRVISDDGSVEHILLKSENDYSDKPTEILSIVDKVELLNEPKMDGLLSASKPYGFRADPLNNPSKYGIKLFDSPFDGSSRLFGKMSGVGRTFKYMKSDDIPKKSSMLNSYKLFLVKAWGNMDESKGWIGGSYSEIIVAEPGDCCSEMYIEVGPFATKYEAESAQKYFYTKFFRAVLYKQKVSQNTARETYVDVPVQDFTSSSDIDWSKSITEIDQQLYKKYGLSQDEIDFIEAHVKEME